MDPHAIINAVFWLGVSGGALVIGSLIVILAQSMEKNNVVSNSAQLPHIVYDEFYDASNSISFNKMKENMR